MKPLESPALRAGQLLIPAMERISFGKPFVETVAAEVERAGAQRVFLVVSGSLNRHTDNIEKLRARLGGRFAGQFDAIPQHVPRDAVLRAADAARAAGADLLVSVGGGSVTDATKTIRLCLEHDLLLDTASRGSGCLSPVASSLPELSISSCRCWPAHRARPSKHFAEDSPSKKKLTHRRSPNRLLGSHCS